MNYKKSSQSLKAELDGDFNLKAVRDIEKQLKDKQELILDLEKSRFVDSHAVIFLYKVMKEGRTVRIKNPPRIFYEVLKILNLHKEWDLKEIVEP